MKRLKLSLKIIFLALSFLMFSSRSFPLFSEEELIEDYPQQAGAYSRGVEQKECLKDFDISKVDFSAPKFAPFVPLLSEYFQCRSAVKDNINECDKLASCPACVNSCRATFNSIHAFYGRLFRNKVVTPAILGMWKEFGSKEVFNSFTKGLLDGDISACEKGPKDNQGECMAMISGDDQYCNRDSCPDTVAYIKAVKSGEIEDCDRIKSTMIKALCRGYIGRNEKACEKYTGFEQFKDSYCE